MLLSIASGRGGGDWATCKLNRRRFVAHLSKQVANTRLNEEPGTLVLGLFLHPLNLGVLVASKVRLHVAEWEGSQLLQSHDGDVLDSTFISLIFEVVVDLARTEKNFLDLVIGDEVCCSVGDDSLETQSNLKLFDVGVSSTILQQFLGDWDDERLAERTANLASEQVEELGSSSALCQAEVHSFHNPGFGPVRWRGVVVSIIKLQEALNTTRGVLWASTVVTVRQEHDEARLHIPLALTRCDELINHDLSSVGEVTKLSLPQNKSGWVTLGVTLLEAKHSILGQM